MNTIYESGVVTVIHGDARDVMPTLGRESVDCIVTDPPYGEAWRSNTRAERFDAIAGDATEEEATDLLAAVTPEMVRVLRRTRHIYTFGLGLTHDLLPEKAQSQLVWDKERIGSGDLSKAWGPSHEPIYFHARASDRANAKTAGGLTARLRRGSVLRVPRLNAKQVYRHPTEKPVELLRQLVESSTTMGEWVLDPFAGSGSTGVAAVLEGRRALLVEVDQGYAEVAAERAAEAESCMASVVGL